VVRVSREDGDSIENRGTNMNEEELDRRPIWRRFFRKLGCFTLISIPVVVIILIGDSSCRRFLPNNLQLGTLKAEVAAVPTPTNSRLPAEHAEVGLLVGMGNHCDFYVGQLWCTELAEDDFASYFHQFSVGGVDVPMRGGGGKTGIQRVGNMVKCVRINPGDSRLSFVVVQMDKGGADTEIFGYRSSLGDWGVTGNECKNGDIYHVYVLDDGHDSTGDIRCH